ncbi:MAG: hypothetical protein WA949_17550 [Phormidesmis sp.]
MFVLTPEDVEISSVQHPKRPKKVPVLSYQDRTFCLLSVFRAHQHQEAQASLRDLIDNEGKACILLEEPHRFSLWRHIRIDKDLLNPMVPVAYVKSCLLMIQALYGDVEQGLGQKQAEAFGSALSMNAQKPLQAVRGLGAALRINPLIEAVPVWGEDDLCLLLLTLHRLGTQFFGRSHFVSRTLSALDILPGKDKAVFLTWLRLSLLGNLWLNT